MHAIKLPLFVFVSASKGPYTCVPARPLTKKTLLERSIRRDSPFGSIVVSVVE